MTATWRVPKAALERNRSTFAVLACTAVLACGEVNAQARGPSARGLQNTVQVVDDSQRARKLAELDNWLRRLTGRFRYEGIAEDPGGYCYVPRGSRVRGIVCVTAQPEPAKGAGDCIGIGDGPGVHCVINLTWPDFKSPIRSVPGQQWVAPLPPALAPAMILYGIDPQTQGIRSLQVDGQSIAEGTLGFLQGDTATFKTTCVNEPPPCRRIIRIQAPPHGRLIRMWIDIESMPGVDGYHRVAGLTLTLRRVAEVPESRSTSDGMTTRSAEPRSD